jgi:hypothetical protein
MATSADALKAIHDWERQHGHSAESVNLALRYMNPLDPGLPALTRQEMEDGANLYEEYRRALRSEEQTRRLAKAERAEMLLHDIMRHASQSA